MDLSEQRIVATVIRNHRWAALATLGESGPEASWVAYVAEVDFSGFLLHLSQLAAHTRNLLRNPCVSLAISEPDRQDQDPQLLARLSIQGEVAVIPRQTEDYLKSAQLYQERLPDSAQLFGFGDFILLRLKPVKARFVGGFSRAYNLDAAGLRLAAVSI